jgi:hypothetical protein
METSVDPPSHSVQTSPASPTIAEPSARHHAGLERTAVHHGPASALDAVSTPAPLGIINAPTEPVSESIPAQSTTSTAPPESVSASVPGDAPPTRLQAGIRKSKIYSDGIIYYGNLAISEEPSNLTSALSDPN